MIQVLLLHLHNGGVHERENFDGEMAVIPLILETGPEACMSLKAILNHWKLNNAVTILNQFGLL